MLKYNKILFTGSFGRFGSIFKKINKNKIYLYPTRKQLDITKKNSINNYFKKNKPKLVIHCAALSRPMNIHDEKIEKSITTNIIGTSNLVNECIKGKIKIIYLSTNYVYPGNKGNYTEASNLNPINNYAWSKLGGECAVQMYKNSLILRICMTEKPFIHKYAFTNVKTNFIFHDKIARILPKLFKYKGIINVGGNIRTVYNFAKKYNPKIKAKKLSEKKSILKLNTSMNINKLKKLLNDKFLEL
tara:strand:+ start:4142 stop:4873 length:732 start_codon:yes stop_codon:yes gene_type:complete